MQRLIFGIFIWVLNLSLLFGNDFRIASVFGDDMVLQRDAQIHIWGWGEPGEAVKVSFADMTHSTLINEEGTWSLSLPAMPAGGPFDMMVMGTDTLSFQNILIGEVWICSGQSNMGMKVGGSSRVLNYKAEIQNADYPEIRLFTVKRAMAAQAQVDVNSKGWSSCSPETIENFSATAYFFGRDLQKGLGNVPIGLIHTSWGGTKIEAWTSRAALTSAGLFEEELNDVSGSSQSQDKQILKEYKLTQKAWRLEVDSLAGDLSPEAISNFTRAHPAWKRMAIPAYWERTSGLEKLDGIVWFQRSLDIPDDWEEQELFLSLGTVDDYDQTFFNGKQIGSNNAHSRPSEYSIAADLVHPGENLLSVRVLDVNRRGGLWGREQDLFVTPKKGGDTLWLSGDWGYKVIMDWADRDVYPPARPYLHNRPSVLYNAMVAPLTQLSMRGVIWYQGEANISKAHLYRKTFPLMIQDWRKAWGRGDFPFLYVQLPNWGPRASEPEEAHISELRDAQRQTLSIPNTSMAVIIDIGDARNIHPKNKQGVGHRLALLALADVYGKDVEARGPIYLSHKIRWGKVSLTFANLGDGLQTNDGREMVGFAVAGKDGEYFWADAHIRGKRIVVSSPDVKHPVAVRYAWGANPDCNLTNSSGIPASPFRTDNRTEATK